MLRAIPGCFLQISHAMHTILHLPSSEECVRLFMRKLYRTVLLKIFFILQCSQRGCFNLRDGDTEENMLPVKEIRCCIPAARYLAQAQSQGQGSPCDARFAVPTGMRWSA